MHEFWILGSNSMAQALAYSLWKVGHTVYVCDEDGAITNKMKRMSGFPALNECFFDETMNITAHLDGIGYCDGIIVCVDIDHLRELAKKLRKIVCPKVAMMYITEGNEKKTKKTAEQILTEELPNTPIIGLQIKGTPDEVVSSGHVETLSVSKSKYEADWARKALRMPALDIKVG